MTDLAPGERVLHEATFSPVAIRYHTLGATIASIIVFTLLALALAIPTFGISLLLLAVPVGIWLLARWYYTLYFQRLSCILTNRSLRVGKGLLFRSEKAIPLDKITDMSMNQGPLMRHLQIESISVETAGQSSTPGGSLVTLVGVEDSRAFRAKVYEQRDRVVGSAEDAAISTATAAHAPASPQADAALAETVREIRDALLRIESRLDNRP